MTALEYENSQDAAPADIGVRLKIATRREHERASEAVGLLSPQLGIEAYRRIIERFYGFFQPLELKLAQFGEDVAPGLDWSLRRRAGLLRDDLVTLGIRDIDRVPLCMALPPLSSVAQRFGCLYVVEGSTLGGQVVTRHLATTVGVTPAAGAKFFYGHGPCTAPMWRDFGRALQRFADSRNEADEVVESAKRTFEALCAWFEGATE